MILSNMAGSSLSCNYLQTTNVWIELYLHLQQASMSPIQQPTHLELSTVDNI